MNHTIKNLISLAVCLMPASLFAQLDAPRFKVFQFPINQIPRIDGNFSDWDIVPESYVVATEELWDDSKKHSGINKKSLDVKVKVGWVKEIGRAHV